MRERHPDRRRPHRPAVKAAALALAAAGLLGALLASPAADAEAEPPQRVIVLGFDGMDYTLTQRLLAAGKMPNFTRLAEAGGFSALGTSVPPQSPVAWSDFITGMDAGGHGIFDFIHRDPETMVPYLSSSRAEPAENVLHLGDYCFPLSSGKVELLRRGTPFWEVLDDRGIDTTIVRMPANYPPSGTAGRELSGMGTPDLLGTYGFFSFYTTELFAFAGQDIGGGEVYEVFLEDDGRVEATLEGPPNPFRCEEEKAEIDFTIYVDPQEPRVKIAIGDEERVLEEGEWTDWVPVEFDLFPTQSVGGIVRFYLRQVRPELEVYASPVNFDPLSPDAPVSHPDSYATELARATGRYYTQGMPEDIRALRDGVFTREDFLSQSKIAGDELLEQYPWVLSQFKDGLLFYYFGNGDLVSHMMWRAIDPEHPAYDPVADAPYREIIEGIYQEYDEIVGYTLDHMPPSTLLVVMSDHGFASARRKFHLNAWLMQNGYLEARNPESRNDPGGFSNVVWSGTRAYGLGLNGLYLNLRGREKNGIVDPREKDALLDELTEKLLAVIDPSTGEPAITKVYRRDEYYKDRGWLELGPDLVVGFTKGTILGDGSSLGGTHPEVFSDNDNAWSGDHLMDHEAVPGILLTNRPLLKPAPTLKDLAPSILVEFGVTEGFPRNEAGAQGADRDGAP